jgi:hypothetical protein
MSVLSFITESAEANSAKVQKALGVKSSEDMVAKIEAAEAGDVLALASLKKAAIKLGWSEPTTPTSEVSSDIDVEDLDVQHYTTNKGESAPYVMLAVASANVDTSEFLFKRDEKGRAIPLRYKATDAAVVEGRANIGDRIPNYNYGKRVIAVRFGDKTYRIQQTFSNLDMLIAQFEAQGKSFIGSTIPIRYNEDLLKGRPSALVSASTALMSLMEVNEELRQEFAALSPEAKAQQRADEAAAQVQNFTEKKSSIFGKLKIG